MAKQGIRVELNSAGVRALLRSPEMASICREHAARILASAGTGYEISEHTGVNRVNASVYPETKEARNDNLKNNTLLKLIRG